MDQKPVVPHVYEQKIYQLSHRSGNDKNILMESVLGKIIYIINLCWVRLYDRNRNINTVKYLISTLTRPITKKKWQNNLRKLN